MELITRHQNVTQRNPHGLITQPLTNPSSSPYNSHCIIDAFPHRHKLVISTHEYTMLYDECRCKPSQLTEDEWNPILRLRDEQLRDATIAIVDYATTVYNLPPINVEYRERNGHARYLGVNKLNTTAYKSLSTPCDKDNLPRPRVTSYAVNSGHFLQTVATNTIIHLNDWRVMDMIRKPYFSLRLHGNNFLQIASTIRNINKNRIIDLLNMTELSGRRLRPYLGYGSFVMNTSPADEDYTGILQVSIVRANVIKNILTDANVDIMSMSRYTFFHEWITDCEVMSNPHHQHKFFADECKEGNEMFEWATSNQRFNHANHIYDHRFYLNIQTSDVILNYRHFT